MSTRTEIGVIAKHAQVILMGQLATMAYGVTDAVVAGRYADNALATLAVATSICVSIQVSLMSVMQALLPIYSELWGAKKIHELARACRQSIYIAAILVVLGMTLMFSASALLAWLDVPLDLRAEAAQYMRILAWALIPGFMFRSFGSLSQAMGLARVVMWLQTSSLLVKIPLTIWFVFGGAGLPAMGMVGCAWATLTVNTLCMLAALACLAWSKHYAAIAFFEQWEKPQLHQLRSFVRLGVPAGLGSAIEITSYTLMSLLIARQGVQATASHQIAASVASVLYMLPLSLSIASITRVSYWLGAGQTQLAHGLARLALKLTVGVAVISCALMLSLSGFIAQAYSKSPEVAQMGASLLIFVALYHLMDAWQTIGCFVLRCWRITLMPMLVYASTLWLLGIGGGFMLAYRGLGGWQAWQHPRAFWLMGAMAMGLAAAIFTQRIWALTRPADPAESSAQAS